MSATDPSPDELASRDVLARIDRNLAETAKLFAEQSKLFAEQRKLSAEADKVKRDRFLAPVATAAAVGAVVATLIPALLRGLESH